MPRQLTNLSVTIYLDRYRNFSSMEIFNSFNKVPEQTIAFFFRQCGQILSVRLTNNTYIQKAALRYEEYLFFTNNARNLIPSDFHPLTNTKFFAKVNLPFSYYHKIYHSTSIILIVLEIQQINCII